MDKFCLGVASGILAVLVLIPSKRYGAVVAVTDAMQASLIREISKEIKQVEKDEFYHAGIEEGRSQMCGPRRIVVY